MKNQTPALAVEFFICFSKAEYALKRAGFLRDVEGYVATDWFEFAKSISDHFSIDISLDVKQAIAYLDENPPLKQILLEDGSLGFRKSPCGGRSGGAFCYLNHMRRVRNNLFHGGKYPMRPMEEPSRDTDLLTHCLSILKYAMTLDDSVNMYFSSEE